MNNQAFINNLTQHFAKSPDVVMTFTSTLSECNQFIKKYEKEAGGI